MKKLASLFLTFVIICMSLSFVQAAENVMLNGPCFATVVQVIDGETFKVKPYGTQDTAFVRLVGVNAKGNQKALDYANEKIMGQLVSITFDNFVPSNSGRYNVVVMTMGEKIINKLLLENGYADVREEEAHAFIFKDLSIAPVPYDPTGKEDFYGYYAYGGPFSYGNLYNYGYYGYYGYNGYYGPGGYYGLGGYFGPGYNGNTNGYFPGIGFTTININTATSAQLSSALTGVDSVIAQSIIDYRTNNGYFNTPTELKNVRNITNTIYNDNLWKISVCTDINTASREELLTLKNITSAEVDKIIDYRRATRFVSKTELYSKLILTRNTYDLNERFIDVATRGTISYAPGTTLPPYYGEALVNLNTASKTQILNSLLDISSDVAQNIVDYRNSRGYFYQVEDLRYIRDFTPEMFYRNVNRASVSTNINTASREELLTLINFTSQDADRIIDYRRNYKFTDKTELYTKSIITRDKYDLNQRFIDVYSRSSVSDGYYPPFGSYYTNINTASVEQLVAALKDVNGEIASSIVGYRDKNAFFKTVAELSEVQGVSTDVFNQNISKITVSTSISNASKEELMTLKGLTSSMADRIVEYRNNKPFESINELYINSLIPMDVFLQNEKYISIQPTTVLY